MRLFQRPIEDILVEEEQGVSPGLGRSGDVLFDGQMSEEGFEFRFARLDRMPFPWNTTNRSTHWT